MELQGTQASTSGASPTAATGNGGQVQQVAEQAREVGQEAFEQARTVGSQAKQEAAGLATEIKDDVRQQFSNGQQRLAVALREFSDELDEVPQRSDGQLAKVATQASEVTRNLSMWLEEREPRDIVRSIEDFGRRRPVAFMLISATAGAIVGRLTRGMLDSARESATSTPSVGTYDTYRTGSYAAPAYPVDVREPVVALPEDDGLARGVGTTGGVGTPMTSTAGLRAQGSTAFPGIPDSEGLR